MALKLVCESDRESMEPRHSDYFVAFAEPLTVENGFVTDPCIYHVNVQKRDGALGIVLRCRTDGSAGAAVLAVRPNGSVGEWNRNNPEKAVQVGDYLLEVNGVTVGLAKELHEHLAGVTHVHLKFSRCDPSSLYAVSTSMKSRSEVFVMAKSI